MIECTNSVIYNRKRHAQRYNSDYDPTIYEPIGVDEMYAMIGLWVRLGITGFCQEELENLFSMREDSSLDAHLAFSRNRYRNIISSLNFDVKKDRATNPDGTYCDKFVHLRKVWDLFFRNCRVAIAEMGQFLTIDESLVGFRGGCGIKVYNPSKPDKYGMLVHNCVDAITKYVYNAVVYTREPNPGNFSTNVCHHKIFTQFLARYDIDRRATKRRQSCCVRQLFYQHRTSKPTTEC